MISHKDKVYTPVQFLWRHMNGYWTASFIIAVCAAMVYFPSLTIHPEIWLENGNNFFFSAWSLSFSQALFTLDNGYVPLFPRIISLLVVKIGLIRWYAALTQWSAIGFLALFYSFFNWRVFRSLIPSDVLRFAITLLLSVVLFRDMEYAFFHNFVYGGFVIVPLLFFVPKERIRYVQFVALCILTFFLVTSKSQFIIFAPFFLYTLVLAVRQRRYREMVWSVIGLAGIALQVVAVQFFITTIPTLPLHDVTLADWMLGVLPDTLYYFIQVYGHILIQNQPIPGWCVVSLVLAVWVTGGYALYTQWQKKFVPRRALLFCAFMNLLAIAFLATTVYAAYSNTLLTGVYPAVEWVGVFPFPQIRHFYLPFVLILFGWIVLMLHFIPRLRLQLLFITAIAVLFFISDWPKPSLFAHDFNTEWYRSDAESFSQWEYYYPLVYRDHYCIPVNYEWHNIKKGCDVLNSDGLLPGTTQGELLSEYHFDSQFSEAASQWMVVALWIRTTPGQRSAPIVVRAIGSDGQAIGPISSLTPDNYTYQYYDFVTPTKLQSVQFQDNNGNPVFAQPEMRFYGFHQDDATQE